MVSAIAHGEDRPRVTLGIGLGVLSVLFGVVFVVIGLSGPIAVSGIDVTTATSAVLGITYLIAGLYHSGRGDPKKGVADLVAASGMTLVFLSGYSRSPLLFVAFGVIALFASGGFLFLWELNVGDIRTRI